MRRLLAMALLSLAIMAAAVGTGYCANEQSLVLHLKFDQEIASGEDLSGQGNDATVNGAQWIENGITGGALQFDGVDDYLDCGNSESLDIADSDFTLELWIKTDTRDKWMSLIDNGRYGAGYGCFDIAIRDSNLLQSSYMWRTAEGDHQYKGRTELIRVRSVNDSRWHHIAVVVDRDQGGGLPRLFIDSVENTGGSTGNRGDAASIVLSNSDPLFIGADSPNSSGYFEGIIDEVRIYKRALTDAEVEAHYQEARAGQKLPTPLSPEARIKESPSYLLLYNNHVSLAFNKQKGLVGAFTLLPGQYLLMPNTWRSSVAYELGAESLSGENMSGRSFQGTNVGEVSFTTNQGEGYAEVAGTVHRVDSNAQPFVRINYHYRLEDAKPYIEAQYTITALQRFKVGRSSFNFTLLGDTVVYQDEYGYIETKLLETSWGQEAISWEEDIPVDNFWMASRKSDEKWSVGVLRPGPTNRKDYRFSGYYLFFRFDEVFADVVEEGATDEARFYLMGIPRTSVDDQRAEVRMIKSLLNELAQ